MRAKDLYACPYAPFDVFINREHQWQVDDKGYENCALLALMKAFIGTFDFEFYLPLIKDCLEKLTGHKLGIRLGKFGL
jgi:hypothetical protein